MRTSDAGLKKIADFEGCVLHAYKAVPSEPFWTVGVGHYGADVSPNMTITKEQALEIFRHDIVKYETYVNNTGLILTQAQFDALTSFAYNCGGGSLQKLVNGRTYQQIADAILLWNKDCTGRVLPGLVKRRQWEHDMFITGVQPTNGCPYPVPTKNLHKNSRGDGVRWLQMTLTKRGYSLVCDGIFGAKTEEAVKAFQADNNLAVDGIVGALTRAKLVQE